MAGSSNTPVKLAINLTAYAQEEHPDPVSRLVYCCCIQKGKGKKEGEKIICWNVVGKNIIKLKTPVDL